MEVQPGAVRDRAGRGYLLPGPLVARDAQPGPERLRLHLSLTWTFARRVVSQRWARGPRARGQGAASRTMSSSRDGTTDGAWLGTADAHQVRSCRGSASVVSFIRHAMSIVSLRELMPASKESWKQLSLGFSAGYKMLVHCCCCQSYSSSSWQQCQKVAVHEVLRLVGRVFAYNNCSTHARQRALRRDSPWRS
eukprot:scaffold7215_cov366-Prasinococcus_capsulatus_cf.AAC.20